MTAEGDAAFLEAVDAALAEGHARAGPRLDYSRGCPTCCNGPFPISALDVHRLRRGLALLEARDPARAAALRARARRVREVLAEGFPGDSGSGRLASDEPPGTDAFYEGYAAVPCPALDPASGRCEVYAHRPLTCRTFGPPVRLGDEDLPACAACFVGSSAEAAACSVVIDPMDTEGVLLRELEAAGESGETLVAFALSF
jgi:Fe-S-cluster containining protein